MNVNASDLQYIEKVIKVADVVGIESIIIEPERVRATSDTGEVFILHTDNVPDMPFGSIGISRTSIFKSRYDVVKSLATKYTASTNKVTLDGQPVEFARSIEMVAPKVSIDYRCANPITIKSPKKILDPISYTVGINEEWLFFIGKAQAAMGSDVIDFILEDGALRFEVKDVNGDAFSFDLGQAIELEPGAPVNFTHTYHTKVLLPILKTVSTPQIQITSMGLIKSIVSDFTVYLKPVVQ